MRNIIGNTAQYGLVKLIKKKDLKVRSRTSNREILHAALVTSQPAEEVKRILNKRGAEFAALV